MKRYALGLVILLLLVLGAAANALAAPSGQAQIETWYFATTIIGDGSLIAFTAEGEVRTLIESGVGRRPEGSWRTGPQQALTVVTVDGELGLYSLAPDGATQIQVNLDEVEDLRSASPVAIRLPYIVFTTNYDRPSSIHFLVNLDTGEVDLLTGSVHLPKAGPRFSEDGRYLRYLSWDPEQNDNWQVAAWTLWERNLDSGEENAVHMLTNVVNNVIPDQYGTRWLQRYTDPETEIYTVTLYFADGGTEVVSETAIGDDLPDASYTLFGDRLVEFNPTCETNCPQTFHQFDGSDSVEFTVPIWHNAFVPLAWADDTHLVELVNETIWYLGADGEAELIGYWTPQNVFVRPREHIVSADGRWVLAINDPDETTRYIVWDTQKQTTVVDHEMEIGAQIRYGEGGFLTTDARFEDFVLYRYTDESVIDLSPPEIGGQFLTVFQDGTVMYILARESDNRQPGIYLYDPVADSYTLLVKNMEPIVVFGVRQ